MIVKKKSFCTCKHLVEKVSLMFYSHNFKGIKWCASCITKQWRRDSFFLGQLNNGSGNYI